MADKINLTTMLNQKKALDGKINLLEMKIQEMLTQLTILKEDKAKKESIITQLSRKPHISEHAKVRYMERVWNLDLSTIEEEILTDDVISEIMNIGTGELNIINSKGQFKIVVRNNIVTTIKT